MCAILDVNAISEVLGSRRSVAGQSFLDRWIRRGRKLVIGGELRAEYLRSYRRIYEDLRRRGVFRIVPDSDVVKTAVIIAKEGASRSNDNHILALARVSGARLLYTKDRKLIDDFKDSRIVRRGKVCPVGENRESRKDRRDLLSQADLCARERTASS